MGPLLLPPLPLLLPPLSPVLPHPASEPAKRSNTLTAPMRLVNLFIRLTPALPMRDLGLGGDIVYVREVSLHGAARCSSQRMDWMRPTDMTARRIRTAYSIGASN